MQALQSILRWSRSLGQRSSVKREIDEELRFHLEQRAAENVAAGMSPEEAARAARKRFGNVQSVREECREARDANFCEGAWRDVCFGLRMLRKNPGFTGVAVATLALGIGANTAIFSLLNTVLLRPLPYRDPDRLMMVQNSYPKLNLPATTLSPLFYFRCKENCKSFEDIGAMLGWSPAFTGEGEPEQVTGAKVTANFFPILGVSPALGRFFTADEDRPGAGGVVVLSDRFWHRRFGGDPKALGRKIFLDGADYEVVGVLPPGLKFGTTLDVWTPMRFTDAEKHHGGDELWAVGRLKPGATMPQAQVELDGVAKPIRDGNAFLKEKEWRILARPIKEFLVGKLRPMLILLLAAVVMVLLIACVNVATLLLAAGIGREKELAIRAALGAGRFRLMRQLFVEGLVLAFLGAGAGLILARGLMIWIAGLIPLHKEIAGWDHLQIDLRVLGFTALATTASALIFGLVPAFQLSKSNVNQPLKESGSRTSQGVRHRRLRGFLVMGEIALATVLLAGAGLVLQNFLRVLRVDPGFDPDHLLTLRVALPESKYSSTAKQHAFFDDLEERVAALPGVTSAALINNPPLWGGTMCTFAIEGSDEGVHGSPGAVTPRYFETMKIPVLYGRAFTREDTASSLPVAIIDEKLARRYWPSQSPLGKRISLSYEGDHPPWREIVGVVAEIKNLGLNAEAKEQYYYPSSQATASSMCLMVRTAGSPSAILSSVQKQISAIDPDQPVHYAMTVRAQLDSILTPQRLPALLVGVFALLALGLAGIGLYGVVAYTTRQRTQEFGIRLALGAGRGHLAWLVLRQGLGLAGVGLAIGLIGAYAFSRVLSGFMSEIQPGDFRNPLFAALILGAVALAACCPPARRAAKVNPTEALRYE